MVLGASERVVVPDGAEPGPISITTNFGTQESPFFFRDDRNILLDFDSKGHESWTAPTAVGIQGVSPVDGAFAYFQSDDHGAWQWVNEMTMQYWAPRGRGNVPISNGLVQDLVFKMEVNVPIEWREVVWKSSLRPPQKITVGTNPALSWRAGNPSSVAPTQRMDGKR